MARIRTIKPDAFLSASLCEVPRETRWTFAGLWTYADDKGRARDDVRLVKAALYPLDDHVSLANIEDDLALLTKIGGVCRYIVNGKRYLHMPNWQEHQKINRPTASKLPPCPEHEDGTSGHVLSGDDSVSDHGGLTEDSPWERKGREQGKDSPSSADADGDGQPDLFDEFWDVYDHKVGRKNAARKYRLALRKPGVTHERLVAAAGSYIARLRAQGKHPQFTAHAETWLNGERWEDEPDNVRQLYRPDRHPAEIADDGTILPPLPKGFFDQ